MHSDVLPLLSEATRRASVPDPRRQRLVYADIYRPNLTPISEEAPRHATGALLAAFMR